MTLLDELRKELGVNYEQALRAMVRLVYNGVDIHGIRYKGKLYRELPNTWAYRNDFTPEEMKFECDGYEYCDCQLEIDRIYVNSSDIEFEWSWGDCDNEYIKDDLELEEVDLGSWFIKLPKRMDEILFPGTIHVVNDCGENTDHRGSDHCQLWIPFENSELTDPTLGEFLKALFLAKSHHFDKWYELYCGIKLSHKEGEWVANLEFDHGS